VAAWQQHLTQQQQQQHPDSRVAAASWLQLPWLLVECYLYVRLATIMADQVLTWRERPRGGGGGGAVHVSLTCGC
jgi:hypothetical protein